MLKLTHRSRSWEGQGVKRGYIGQECRFKSNCSKSGGRHHYSICSKRLINNVSHISPIAPSSTEPPHKPSLNPEPAPFTTLSMTSHYVNANKTVRTDRCVQSRNATVCFGSVGNIKPRQPERSYITNRIKNALSLSSTGKQHMSIRFRQEKHPDLQDGENQHIHREGPDKELNLFSVLYL